MKKPAAKASLLSAMAVLFSTVDFTSNFLFGGQERAQVESDQLLQQKWRQRLRGHPRRR